MSFEIRRDTHCWVQLFFIFPEKKFGSHDGYSTYLAWNQRLFPSIVYLKEGTRHPSLKQGYWNKSRECLLPTQNTAGMLKTSLQIGLIIHTTYKSQAVLKHEFFPYDPFSLSHSTSVLVSQAGDSSQSFWASVILFNLPKHFSVQLNECSPLWHESQQISSSDVQYAGKNENPSCHLEIPYF